MVESYGRVCDAYIELANYRLAQQREAQAEQKQTRHKSLLIAKMTYQMFTLHEHTHRTQNTQTLGGKFPSQTNSFFFQL